MTTKDEGPTRQRQRRDVASEQAKTERETLIEIYRLATAPTGLHGMGAIAVLCQNALARSVPSGAKPTDTQRCIDARNKLNAAIHGEGAVIDDLESAVAAACQMVARYITSGDQPPAG